MEKNHRRRFPVHASFHINSRRRTSHTIAIIFHFFVLFYYKYIFTYDAYRRRRRRRYYFRFLTIKYTRVPFPIYIFVSVYPLFAIKHTRRAYSIVASHSQTCTANKSSKIVNGRSSYAFIHLSHGIINFVEQIDLSVSTLRLISG